MQSPNCCLFRRSRPNIVTRTFFLSEMKIPNRFSASLHFSSTFRAAYCLLPASAGRPTDTQTPRQPATLATAVTKLTKLSEFCHSHQTEKPCFLDSCHKITRTKPGNFASPCGTPENDDKTQ